MNERELIGKKLNNVEFIEKDGKIYGRLKNYGVNVDYELKPVKPERPVEAVLMDLDGTTVTSEEFWMYVIELTMKEFSGDKSFTLAEEDIPFVSGYTTADHLKYCVDKYYPKKGLDLERGMTIYHVIAKTELDKIMRGGGKADSFKPAEGLKDFLLGLKERKIKIGLVTSGLDYKAIPEIVAAFRVLGMGDPLKFYDAVITGGRRKDDGEYGTIGEVAAKPHPWVYTELAYRGLKIKNPSGVFGIEDSAAGAMSLRFAGFPVIGVNCGNIEKSGMDVLCYKKVDKLCEILSLL